MKRYHFSVVLVGSGRDADEAWRDAVEAISLESGPTPDEDEYEIVEDMRYCKVCGEEVHREEVREHMEDSHDGKTSDLSDEEILDSFEE